jgi:hypothetical protein
MPHRADFQEFVERKTREAERAIVLPLHTVEDRSHRFQLPTIGNAWTRANYDGDFHLFDPPPSLPAVSMVFVLIVRKQTVGQSLSITFEHFALRDV